MILVGPSPVLKDMKASKWRLIHIGAIYDRNRYADQQAPHRAVREN